MEFDIEKDKVIGIVAKSTRGTSARVAVMGIQYENGRITTLEVEDARELFAPNGYVFVPDFFGKTDFVLNDIISLYVERQLVEDEKNDCFFSRKSIKEAHIEQFGVVTCELDSKSTGSLLENQTIDLNNISNLECPCRDFYGIIDSKYIIGKLRKTTNGLIPAVRKRVQCYDLEQNNKLVYHDKVVGLIKIPEVESFLVDCDSDKELFKWFREQLLSVSKDYVELMDKKAKWRTELPILFADLNKDDKQICEIRLKRIEKIASSLNIVASDIRDFIDSSDVLKDVFVKAIELHKKEFKSEYEKELKEDKKKQEDAINKSLSELKTRQKDLKKEVDKAKVELNKVKSDKVKKTAELDAINNNKDRILEDFSIIKDVLRVHSNQVEKATVSEKSYVLESVEPSEDTTNLASLEEFEKNLQYKLKEYQVNPCLAKSLWQVLLFYKMSFISDVRLGVALTEAANNSKYILTQVGPDWLHFKDLWNNGLGEIWQSAHENSDMLHFLILEDINLSSPECYARPLLDIVNGVRKHIPYGKTTFPNNLRILMTKASVDDPAIGLPLIQDTFKENIGFFGFVFDLKVTQEPEYEVCNSVLTATNILYNEEDENELKNWSEQNNFWIKE